MSTTKATYTERVGYNGWSNYETWLANLWLINNEAHYALLQEALSKKKFQTYEKAEWLEMMLRDALYDEIKEPCFWQDLLRAAFGRIDWSEIIEKNID